MMRSQPAFSASIAVVLVVIGLLGGAGPAAAADPYTLESQARYEIDTDAREIGVTVDLQFTNTTPNPAGSFSVFSEIRVAVHDEATGFAASDRSGDLDVKDGVRTIGGAEVHVATIELREPLRYKDSISVDFSYVLPDGEESVRVRPSVVVFQAWSFGTSGQVEVAIPAGYEMRVDGDPLEENGDRLVSGAIDDPTAWLALVTAVSPADQTAHEATVPLQGGTADLLVRSFSDDEAWGERTLAVVSDALPLIETELGLPFPVRGQLILTESVALDQSGFGETPATGAEIAISFDQPPFTTLHQVTHVWLPTELVQARWIAEGLASQVAARVGEELGIEPPYDPAVEAERRSPAEFRLDEWPGSADRRTQSYGYPAAWAVMDELGELAGEDAIPTVLARVAASMSPYEPAEVEPEPATGNGAEPRAPLTSRSFLDHLEAVSGADLADLFAERILSPSDAALLPDRAEARAALDELVSEADGWGAPDAVRAAMADWDFAEALEAIGVAQDWLAERDALLAELSAAGLNAPDRLREAYLAYGGGSEAGSELATEADVVRAYSNAAERVNGERSFIERLGLVGGPDPAAQLALANGRFTDGDLRGAVEAVAEAERIVTSAEAGGIVRLVSLLLVVLILIGLAVVLFRRRAYTSPQ
jgi:hypothetical protein